ncbi:MAG: ABC transporter permease [Gemmatimonadales bacterium]|nr:MAG: ABC transporter permease [Gemmatimonadales bacterium]
MPVSLQFRAGFRHLLRHPWNLLLPILGIALGVAVTVAIDLAIQSSREAFRVSSETVAGRATHQIQGGVTGVPDSLPALLLRETGVRALAPVVEGWGSHPSEPDRPLRLLGIDPFSEAPFRPYLAGGPGAEVDGTRLLTERGAAFVSRATADRLGVAENDAFTLLFGGGLVELRLLGVLEPEDEWSRRGLRDLIVVDLSEAQAVLGRGGELDRIDLLLDEAVADSVLERIRAVLPPELRVEPAGSRERTMEEMVRAFDLNLTALSLLGLVFGVFLIYNTMTFSVVRRRRHFGTLRALGVTRGGILKSVLGEAAFLGVAGSVVGVLLGILLGRGLVRLVTRTINDLYFVVSVEGLALPPDVLLRGGLLGVVATLLAALPPAWEATSVSAREALARSTVETRVRALIPVVAGIGVGLLGLGGALILLTERSLGAAFTGLFAIIVGAALVVPILTIVLVGVLRPLLRRTVGILGAMAARGVVTALSRTAPAVAALVIAVSVTVGLGVMIQSFRGSVVQWLDVTLQADLYVSAPGGVSARAEGSLPEGLDELARGLPGVVGVSTYRGAEFDSDYGRTRLVGLDLDPRGEDAFDVLEQMRGLTDDGLFERFRAGDGALISEPFAFRHDLSAGDTVRFASARGPAAFPVLAVFRDYGAEMGTVMIGRVAWDRGWDDRRITSLGIFLEPGASEDPVEAGLRSGSGSELLEVRSNQELRQLTLEVFDRTFEVTRVLRLLAFLVAFVGVLSALMALQLERSRELGVLRANGMTPGQTWGLVTAQTGLMGLVSGILALPLGLLMAVIMIHVVNRRSFGWTLEMTVSPMLLAQAVGLALAGALLAGVYPSWRMARTSPAEALRDE